MARPTHAQLRAVGDFAPVYRWDIQFSANAQVLAGVSSEDLNLRCESTEQPKMTGQSIEVNIRGIKKKQPGIYSPGGPITFTFVETVDNKVSQLIKNWEDLLWDPETGKSLPSDSLKLNITITRLDNEDNPIWEAVMYGAYLEDSESGQLDGVTSDVMKPTMTLAYDYCKKKAV